MKKRIISSIIALAMVVGMLPMTVMATDDGGVTLGPDLVLNGKESATEPDGYTWTKSDADGDYDTLTLTDDLTINGILKLSDGGTIDLDGHTLTIKVEYNPGLDASSYDLTINGNGTLDITSTGNGIVANNITIEDVTVDINANDNGINTNSGLISLNNVDATIVSTGANGIDASESNLEITGTSNIDITSGTDGISLSNGDFSLANESNVTIKSNSRGIYTNAFSGGSTNIDITTSGTVDITSADYGIYAYVESDTCTGNVAIGNSATVNTDSIYVTKGTVAISETAQVNTYNYIAMDDSTADFTLAETANFNGMVSTKLIKAYSHTVYGDVEISSAEQAEAMFAVAGSVAFTDGSKLTIAEDVDLDWSDYAIDWTNANIANDGTITLSDGTPSELAIAAMTGTGSFAIGDTTYDTDGGITFGGLTFASDTAIESNDYFTWTKSEGSEVFDTLTLSKDTFINTTDADGIAFSDSGTIDLAGFDLTITTTGSDKSGISTDDDLTITGTGTVDILTTGKGASGINADAGDITISDSANVNVKTTGNEAYGIYANAGNITISDSANVNVKTTGYIANGINARDGDITISDTSNVTVNAKGSTAEGIRANGNDIEITTTGEVTTYAAGSGINTSNAAGSITITNATVVNTSVNSINSSTITINDNANVSSTSKLALGGESEKTYVDGTFALDDATLNAVVAVANEDYTTTYTVYGNVVVTSTLLGWNLLFNDNNNLDFAENSKLTINQGVAVSFLEKSSIDWDNVTVFNNGIIYLINDDYYSSANDETDDEDTKTDIASLNITGDGYIVRTAVVNDNSMVKNYRTVEVYNNDGIAVDYVIESYNSDYSQDTLISLDETSVIDNDNYTWTVDGTVGTLTVNNDLLFNGGIGITGVTDVNIDATNGKITIAGCGVEANLTAPGDLTITGDLVVTGYIEIDGKLTVDGNLVAGAVFAGSMEVPTGSTVNLLGEIFGNLDHSDYQYADHDKTYALRLSDATQEPTLTLGNNVKILTAGVTYSAAKYENNYSTQARYIGTFINDGDTPDFNTLTWYNIATAVSIGKISSPVITSPSTTEYGTLGGLTATDTTTDENGNATTTVEPDTTTSNGTTSATVDDDVIDSAIEDAVDNKDTDGTTNVEIKVPSTDTTDSVEVTVSKDALESLADSDVENLTVSTDIGSVTIPSSALTSIVSQSSGSKIVITIIAMEKNDHLTSQQQTLVKDAQTYDLYITSDGVKINSFGGHKITISLPYELADGENTEHIVVWYLGDNGEISALDSDYDADLGMTIFATPHFSYYLTLHHNNPFVDVTVDDYFYTSVMFALEMGITEGTSENTFSPTDTSTRAEAVMFLWNSAGQPKATVTSNFTDVAENTWYAEAVNWAVSEEITTGTSQTEFSPDVNCTRAEIVTFLYRFANSL